jgi:hypothetical protein
MLSWQIVCALRSGSKHHEKYFATMFECLDAVLRSAHSGHDRRAGGAARSPGPGVFGGPLNIPWSHSRQCSWPPFWRCCCHCGGRILPTGRGVHDAHRPNAQAVAHAAGRGLGSRRARACDCRPAATMDLLLAPGEPASDAIRTTALMRHLAKEE